MSKVLKAFECLFETVKEVKYDNSSIFVKKDDTTGYLKLVTPRRKPFFWQKQPQPYLSVCVIGSLRHFHRDKVYEKEIYDKWAKMIEERWSAQKREAEQKIEEDLNRLLC